MESLKNFDFYMDAAAHAEVDVVETTRGQRIPLVWLRPPQQKASESGGSSPSTPPRQRLVMIHCHGNATDIGLMMGLYFEFVKQLGVEVVGVEYSGYGVSTGKATYRDLHADVDAAYRFVRSKGVPPERIVVYGQSVGSGPAVGLAAKRPLGGLVLHSAMLSGIKVLDPDPDRCCRPSCCFNCFDFFQSEKLMAKMNCPGFVIHGQLDETVPFYHGMRLRDALPKASRWPGYFPRQAGHNDVIEVNAQSFFGEVNGFMRFLDERASGGPSANAAVTAMKPPQICMSEDMGKGNALPFREPVVGPEDGRYEGARLKPATLGRGA
eukprot:TRINITY_DN36954_c0_g1_i2.p1 TRINITY_DN36954_c0_g1~~TRINITY_DN36954_c0_g1_i2.p1  ORF type:complete len:323 (-),score=62.03 TRINITY_DN36954_c0_g1_i2:31-999(-)